MKKIICLVFVTLITNSVYALDNGYTGGEQKGSGDYLTAAIMIITQGLAPKKYPKNVVTDNTQLGKEKPFTFESKE